MTLTEFQLAHPELSTSAIYETDKILISRNGVSMAATSNKFIETSALPIATTLSPTDKIPIEQGGLSKTSAS